MIVLNSLPSSPSVIPSSSRWNLLPSPQALTKSLSDPCSPILLLPQGHLALSLRNFAVEYISAANSDLEVNASMGSFSFSEHLARKQYVPQLSSSSSLFFSYSVAFLLLLLLSSIVEIATCSIRLVCSSLASLLLLFRLRSRAQARAAQAAALRLLVAKAELLLHQLPLHPSHLPRAPYLLRT